MNNKINHMVSVIAQILLRHQVEYELNAGEIGDLIEIINTVAEDDERMEKFQKKDMEMDDRS